MTLKALAMFVVLVFASCFASVEVDRALHPTPKPEPRPEHSMYIKVHNCHLPVLLTAPDKTTVIQMACEDGFIDGNIVKGYVSGSNP